MWGNTTGDLLNQGSGIGLSITKEFVKMHGGMIEVETEPGNGSVFTITLPSKVANPALPAEIQQVTAAELTLGNIQVQNSLTIGVMASELNNSVMASVLSGIEKITNETVGTMA